MFTWQKLTGYKIWWNNTSIALPEKHIETIIKESGGEWETIQPIEWTPFNNVVLYTTKEQAPTYIKCSNGKETYYFLFESIDKAESINELNEIVYKYVYVLDEYMSIFWNKLKILKDKNISVKHLRGFRDRFVYKEKNNELASFGLNFIEQKHLGNTLDDENYQLIRTPLYGVDELEIWNDNFTSIPRPQPDDMIKISNWANSSQTIERAWHNFTNTNINNRYSYIICKSSALQKGKVSKPGEYTQHAKDSKLLIPLFENQENDILEGLLNFGIDIPQDSVVNALSSGNFIGRFDCDVPYSVFYALSKSENSKIKILYGHNKIKDAPGRDIVYFEVPTNYAPRIKLIDYSEYEGFQTKIKHLFNNITKIDELTEPILLNPSYYTEKCVIDNDKFISTDISLLNYQLDDIEGEGLSLYVYLCFDNILSVSYDYGDFNNQQNTIWNNKNSNIRNQISTDVGVQGSSAANFYESNPNTLTTGLYERKINQASSWVSTFTGAPSFYHTEEDKKTKEVSKVFNPLNMLRFAGGIINNAMNQAVQNRKLASQINNIKNSANTVLSNPYVDASVPNKSIKGKSLFNTYAYEIHPWDKERLLTDVLTDGYYINKIGNFNDYDNRIIMNVLHLDISFNYDDIIKLLQENDKTIFNIVVYDYAFLSWLSTTHRLYKNNVIINCVSYKEIDYHPNLENYIPNFPSKRKDIKNILTNLISEKDFKYKKNENPNQIIDELKALNPEAPADLWSELIILSHTLKEAYIGVKPTDEKYYGFVTMKAEAFYHTKTIINEEKWYDNDLNVMGVLHADSYSYINMPNKRINIKDIKNIVINTFNNLPNNWFGNSITIYKQDDIFNINSITIVCRGVGNDCFRLNLTHYREGVRRPYIESLHIASSRYQIGDRFACQTKTDIGHLYVSCSGIGVSFCDNLENIHNESRYTITVNDNGIIKDKFFFRTDQFNGKLQTYINLTDIKPSQFLNKDAHSEQLCYQEHRQSGSNWHIILEGQYKEEIKKQFPNDKWRAWGAQVYFRNLNNVKL